MLKSDLHKLWKVSNVSTSFTKCYYFLYYKFKTIGAGANAQEQKLGAPCLIPCWDCDAADLSFFDAYNEDPIQGPVCCQFRECSLPPVGVRLFLACSPCSTVLELLAPGMLDLGMAVWGRKDVTHLFPLFYITRVACLGCVGFEVAVWEQPSYYLAPRTSESAARKYLLVVYLFSLLPIWI